MGDAYTALRDHIMTASTAASARGGYRSAVDAYHAYKITRAEEEALMVAMHKRVAELGDGDGPSIGDVDGCEGAYDNYDGSW